MAAFQHDDGMGRILEIGLLQVLDAHLRIFMGKVLIQAAAHLHVQQLHAAADGQNRFLLFQGFVNERHFEVVAQGEGRPDVQARLLAVKIWGNILSPSQKQCVDLGDVIRCRFGGADRDDQRISSRGLDPFHESDGCVCDGDPRESRGCFQ